MAPLKDSMVKPRDPKAVAEAQAELHRLMEHDPTAGQDGLAHLDHPQDPPQAEDETPKKTILVRVKSTTLEIPVVYRVGETQVLELSTQHQVGETQVIQIQAPYQEGEAKVIEAPYQEGETKTIAIRAPYYPKPSPTRD